MRYWLLALLLGFTSNGIASEQSSETSPCPGLVSVQGYDEFERSLVVTDDIFSSIEDCEKLNRFYLYDQTGSNREIDFSTVNEIVDAIWQPVDEESPFQLIEAIMSWLKSLGLEDQADALESFWDEYMPSKESIEFFFSVLLWLIIAATVFLVIREFYLAGMLRFPGFAKKALVVNPLPEKPTLQWQQILTLPMREQISALLRYSIEQLVAIKAIPASKNYTNQELKQFLQQVDPLKANLLGEQIQLTEPVIYGDQMADDKVLKSCREKAHEISAGNK